MGSSSNITSQITKKSTSDYILNDENLFRLQKKVVKLSGIPPEDISQKLICVGKEPNGKRIDMLTIIFGLKDIERKPIMVFAHGYAASAALYFGMYKRLMEHFTVVTIDHLGMGASSRP